MCLGENPHSQAYWDEFLSLASQPGGANVEVDIQSIETVTHSSFLYNLKKRQLSSNTSEMSTV